MHFLRFLAFAALVAPLAPEHVSQDEGAPPEGKRAPAPAFDADAAWRHLEAQVGFGARPSGSPGNARTREYIAEKLVALGLTVRHETFESATPEGMIEFTNVFADLPPTAATADGAPPRIVVLLTHFDTKRLDEDFVGANDGGSGTAVQLELARSLLARNDRGVTYRFLFVDGEEALRSYWAGEDNCYGSRHHVRELTKSGELDRIAACITIDMVGDRDLQFVTELNSDPFLLKLFFDAAHAIGLGRHVDGEERNIKDDHLRFAEAGVPSLDLIDFDYGPDHAYWHAAADTLAHCSKESLDATGRIVLAGLEKLDAQLAPRSTDSAAK